jgi:hypothetical protein
LQAEQESGDGAEAFFGFGDFGAGSEGAVDWVGDDFFYGFLGFGSGFGIGFGIVRLLLRKIAAGDLEAVEKETGSAWIEIVGGDALKDFSDGGLDGGTVFGHREVEGSAAATALIGIDDGFAGSVVVVAEVFSA